MTSGRSTAAIALRMGADAFSLRSLSSMLRVNVAVVLRLQELSSIVFLHLEQCPILRTSLCGITCASQLIQTVIDERLATATTFTLWSELVAIVGATSANSSTSVMDTPECLGVYSCLCPSNSLIRKFTNL